MPRRSSRLPLTLFGLLLALCVVLALAFVIEEVPFEDVPSAAGGAVERVYTGHGTAHSRFPSMNHGGAGLERHTPILWLAWSFGLLQLALIVGCLALGVKHIERVWAPLVACGVVLGLILTMMVVTYQGYLDDVGSSLFFSLPAPTAWFLYGFWPAEFLVVTLYVLVFSRAIVTREDMGRFREILAANRRRQAGNP